MTLGVVHCTHPLGWQTMVPAEARLAVKQDNPGCDGHGNERVGGDEEAPIWYSSVSTICACP